MGWNAYYNKYFLLFIFHFIHISVLNDNQLFTCIMSSSIIHFLCFIVEWVFFALITSVMGSLKQKHKTSHSLNSIWFLISKTSLNKNSGSILFKWLTPIWKTRNRIKG